MTGAGFVAAAGQCKMSYTDIIRDFVRFLHARAKK